MRAAWAFACCAAWSCSPTRNLTLEARGAQTVLLAWPSGDGTLDLEAVSLADSAVRIEVPDRRPLQALFYDCSIAGLALPEGQSFRLDPAGRSLPKPTRALQLEAGATDWVPSLEPPAVRVAGPGLDPCLHLSISAVVRIPDVTETSGLFALDGVTLLVVGVGGEFYRVDRSGATRLPIPATIPHSSGFIAADRNIWLAGGGTLAKGRPEIGFTVVSTTIALAGSAAIDGPKTGTAAFELFAATNVGSFARFDGSRWTALDHAMPNLSRAGVSRSGVGAAVAIGLFPERILNLAGGVVREELAELVSTEKLYSTAMLEGFGPVVGTDSGRVLVRDPGSPIWRGVRLDPTSSLKFHLLVPVDDGLLAGGEKGIVDEVHPGGASCEPLAFQDGTVRSIVALGDGFAASGDTQGTTSIYFLDRGAARRPSGCFLAPSPTEL